MEPLPIGCRERYQELSRRGLYLLDSFVNGNRGDVLQALLEMEPKAGLAILTEMMRNASDDVQESLNRYFMDGTSWR
jgi:hypothetical protein